MFRTRTWITDRREFKISPKASFVDVVDVVVVVATVAIELAVAGVLNVVVSLPHVVVCSTERKVTKKNYRKHSIGI